MTLSLKQKKPVAVVTGGAGFIGSHTVDILLSEGYSVRIIDNMTGGHEKNLIHLSGNPNLSLEEMDIRDIGSDSLIFKDVEYVFHFAGIGDIVPSIERPKEYMSVNVQGTICILEASRNAVVKKFVYAASSSCYGLAETPTTESHPIQPQYPYALSKYQGEQAVFHWYEVYNLPVNSIRIFNAYGPRVRTTGAYGAVFGVFFKQKLAGKPYTVVGDGTQSRDFIFVTDVARAFLAAAQTDLSGEVFNVGADKPQPVNRLVEIIGGDVIYIPKRPGEPECTWADIAKIKSDLGWEPQVDFKDGVKFMIQNIDNWKDAPLWEPDSIAKATEKWFQYMSPDV
jgi:UDP-glucose 4-epimerase